MKSILIASLLLISVQAFSQTFEVPAGYSFETKDDYSKYEQDVIEGVNWLLKTPLSQEQGKRKEVNAFLMKWLSGSPSVTIEVNSEIITFMDCPDCLMVFLGGWAKQTLETKDNTDKVKGNLAGIESVIEFYNLNKATLGNNKAVQKYIKMQEKGKLEEYVKARI